MGNKPKEFFDVADQQLNAESAYKTHWGNFGYWRSAGNYPQACEALATLLGDAARLDTQSHLLDCGFGCGDQLLTWINGYHVASIVGINLSCSQTAVAQRKVKQYQAGHTRVSLYQGDAVNMILSNTFNEMPPITHIIALDCAYHFQQRAEFMRKAHERLSDTGRLVLTDITFSTNSDNWAQTARLYCIKTLLKFARIPADNIISVEQYRQTLSRAGFSDIDITDISEAVFSGFCRWFEGYKKDHASAIQRAWLKYTLTTGLLRWACRHGVMQYQLVVASK